MAKDVGNDFKSGGNQLRSTNLLGVAWVGSKGALKGSGKAVDGTNRQSGTSTTS